MELGNSLMAVEFRRGLDDFLETVRAREPQSTKLVRRVLMTVGLVLLAVLLGVPFAMKDVPGFLAAFLIGVLPLAVLMVILPWYYKPDRFYRSYHRSLVFNRCNYEIAERGIKVSTDTSESALLWKAFNEYSESKTQLVLTSGMVQYIFPKHAIEQSKLTELVELVRGKVALQGLSK
jgi:hypothetical protein